MTKVTEIVQLTLREGSNPEEEGSPAAKIFKESATTLHQQKGVIRSYWGLKIEDPKVFVWTIDWEDIQDHKDFANSDRYPPFTGHLAELFDLPGSPVIMYHVNFIGENVAAREAPVTEIAAFNISTAADDASKSALEDHTLKLLPFAADAGASGSSVGWVIEEQEKKDDPESKTKLLHLFIGWKSVEEHREAQGREEFPGLLGPIRALSDVAAFHVKLHAVQ